MATACRKNTNPISKPPGNGYILDIFPFNMNRCLLVQNINDSNGFATTIYYNKHKNPDSVYIGLPGIFFQKVYAKYDMLDRLKEIHWANNDNPVEKDYQILTYDEGILPTGLKYIAADYKQAGFNDSVNATWKFTYNRWGNITKIDFFNIYANFRYQLDYEYIDGNVSKVTRTYPDFIQVVNRTKYDNKPNAWGGNLWFKYLLLTANAPYDELHSQNNILEDKGVVTPGPSQGFYEQYKYKYDNRGFAIKQLISGYSYYNGDTTNFGVISQSNLSTCSVIGHTFKLQMAPSKNTFSQPDYLMRKMHPWIISPDKKD